VLFGAVFVLSVARSSYASGLVIPNLFPFPNDSGLLRTFSIKSPIDLNNPFFKVLGTNGRTCAPCHRPDQGMAMSADRLKARFLLSAGFDPIFSTNDGSNCDHGIDVSTIEGRRQAYSLLTSRALIRLALPVPSEAEFEVSSVSNPYGCNETTTLSVYRRVLPS